MATLGSNFYSKLVQLSSEVGMQPEDILAIMTSESGISPTAHNPHGDASGLMQFMPSTLGGVGFHGSPDQFRQLSGEQQLPYIKNYIENQMKVNGGPFTSAAQYYVAVFWPVALKLPGVRHGDPSTPIVEENPRTVRDPKTGKSYSKKYYDIGIKIDPGFERVAYKQNSLFHGDTPGAITYGDMMRQTEKNKRNPLYARALSTMQKETGYVPNQRTTPTNMMAQKSPKVQEDFYSMIDKLLSELSPSSVATASKRLYQKVLPTHHILIGVSTTDHTSAVEFSRVLCAALDEELSSNSYTHTDGEKVEIECAIPGPATECFAAVQQLSKAIEQTFEQATSKIGGIQVHTQCMIDKRSSYQPISLKMADTLYRNFLLKFM